MNFHGDGVRCYTRPKNRVHALKHSSIRLNNNAIASLEHLVSQFQRESFNSSISSVGLVMRISVASTKLKKARRPSITASQVADTSLVLLYSAAATDRTWGQSFSTVWHAYAK